MVLKIRYSSARREIDVAIATSKLELRNHLARASSAAVAFPRLRAGNGVALGTAGTAKCRASKTRP
jgi:hypothetical protein